MLAARQVMRRRILLPGTCRSLAWLLLLGGTCVACGPPAAAAVPEEDAALVQEVLRRQEQRVTRARAEAAQLARELRLVEMRRRMLERAGRQDLAAALETEEH